MKPTLIFVAILLQFIGIAAVWWCHHPPFCHNPFDRCLQWNLFIDLQRSSDPCCLGKSRMAVVVQEKPKNTSKQLKLQDNKKSDHTHSILI